MDDVSPDHLLRAAADLATAAHRDTLVSEGEALCKRIQAARPLDDSCLRKAGLSLQAVHKALEQFARAVQALDHEELSRTAKTLNSVTAVAENCSRRITIDVPAIRPTRGPSR